MWKITSTAPFNQSARTIMLTTVRISALRYCTLLRKRFLVSKCNVTTLKRHSLFAQCTANSLAEVSSSRQSVGFIYKWANRRADDCFHACGKQITVQEKWIQLSSWALILCHWNKAILFCSDQQPLFHFSCQWDTHGEVCPDLIGVEFAVRVLTAGGRQWAQQLF